MANNTTSIKGLEQGRAKFAYECVDQVLSIKNFKFEGNEIETDKYIKKIFENKLRKHEQKEDQRILEDFFAEPLNKMNVYSSGSGFEKDIANLYEKTKKEYKSYVKKIPMLIKTNGLGATFAFMLSKGGTYEVIGEQVLCWLKIDEKGFQNDNNLNSFKELNKKIIDSKSPEYRALTIEVLAFFNWLRRFADGLIEGEVEND